MILIHDIRLPLSAGEPQAYEKALRLARIPRGKVSHLGIARLSVDARHGQPKLVYTVAVTLKEEGKRPPVRVLPAASPSGARPISRCRTALCR